MAGADYYHCDGCGCKTFYDADLHYGEFGQILESPRKTPMPDGDVGDMVVLCTECTKKYEIVIKKRKK